MRVSAIALFVTSILGVSAAPATKRCAVQRTVDYAGVKLTICPKTSYVGETIKEFGGFKDTAACARQCAVTARCERAVYERQGQWCLIKGPASTDPANANDMYDTITVVEQIEDGKVLNSCPAGFNKLKKAKGKVPYLSCINSDFNLDSVDILGGVTSAAACADICAPRPGCFAAVWVAEFNACHIKSEAQNPPLVYRRGMTRLTVANTPSGSS